MQSLGIFYKSVITDLLWTLLLSGALPSSYLSLRREAVLVSRRFSWKLSLGAEACNKLVRGSGEAQHSRIVSKSLVMSEAAPPECHLGQHLRALLFALLEISLLLILSSVSGMWQQKRTQGLPWLCLLALSAFFWPFNRVVLPFFLHRKSRVLSWN